jgi:hypothetical protein
VHKGPTDGRFLARSICPEIEKAALDSCDQSEVVPTMPSPPVLGLFVFAMILLGAFVGRAVGTRLPKDHLTDETRTLVSVSMAVVGTLSALVLGLLISNANTAFSERNREITALSANMAAAQRLY